MDLHFHKWKDKQWRHSETNMKMKRTNVAAVASAPTTALGLAVEKPDQALGIRALYIFAFRLFIRH